MLKDKVEKKVKDIIRLALASEYKKVPMRREDITKKSAFVGSKLLIIVCCLNVLKFNVHSIVQFSKNTQRFSTSFLKRLKRGYVTFLVLKWRSCQSRQGNLRPVKRKASKFKFLILFRV